MFAKKKKKKEPNFCKSTVWTVTCFYSHSYSSLSSMKKSFLLKKFFLANFSSEEPFFFLESVFCLHCLCFVLSTVWTVLFAPPDLDVLLFLFGSVYNWSFFSAFSLFTLVFLRWQSLGNFPAFLGAALLFFLMYNLFLLKEITHLHKYWVMTKWYVVRVIATGIQFSEWKLIDLVQVWPMTPVYVAHIPHSRICQLGGYIQVSEVWAIVWPNLR